MDAFDSDVLIYAAAPEHPLGRRVAALFPAAPARRPGSTVGIGSTLLVPEVLSKPLRDDDAASVTRLSEFLIRLDLRPVDRAIAAQAAVLGAQYKLRMPDATHLATAIRMGAQRFITNNSRDFGRGIEEIAVVFPADLPEPA
jgi:predicted nucleic acid-binding protein